MKVYAFDNDIFVNLVKQNANSCIPVVDNSTFRVQNNLWHFIQIFLEVSWKIFIFNIGGPCFEIKKYRDTNMSTAVVLARTVSTQKRHVLVEKC